MKQLKLHNIISNQMFLETILAGTDERDFSLLEKNMKKYFPDISKEDYEKYIYENVVLNKIIKQIQSGFEKWYDFKCEEIVLNNLYQKHFNSYAYIDDKNPVLIHIDQLLETVAYSFVLVMLKWIKEIQNDRDTNEYFIYLIYLFNELCILGQLPAEDGKEDLLDKVANDFQILHLATDCYWTIIAFTIAHEIAHAYQMKIDREYWEKNKKEAEFYADEIAYDILLGFLMEQNVDEMNIEKYTYLAPMMYMDFFELYYYTDYVLYGIQYNSKTHPTPGERKERLFNVVDRDVYQFDTEDGNAIYQGFCMVFDLYEEKLDLYKRTGKLDGIIRTELRKLR